jgi:predicted dehydrogenase
MIHDIDIVLKLARSPVAKIDAIGVSVIGEHEDICNARITFANGCVANVTASRLALKTERKLRVFSSDAYVSVDYQKRYGVVVRRTGNLDTVRETAEKIRRGDLTDLSGLSYTDLVQVEELQISDTEPLRAQLESFVAAVRNGTTPEVTVEDGLAAVETAVWIVGAIAPQPL